MGKIGALLNAKSMPYIKVGRCALSGDHLMMPIYACSLGNTYNKYALKKHFSMRKKFPEMVDKKFAHVKGPFDVRQLNLTVDPKFNPKVDSTKSGFICPITKKVLDGQNKFVFLWTCGCVYSKEGLDTLNNTCTKCNKQYAFNDVIPLNPTEEEVKILIDNAQERRPLKMGCDGGTIPKRDELVRKKKKEEKVSKEDSRNVKWKHCAMSQGILEKPIVACELGRIFNKESVINFLIQKKSSPDTVDVVFAEYIRNLKDVKELKLTTNPSYKDDADRAGLSQKEAQFVCPITGIEMNGCYKFMYLWTCGCVFSERALKQIKDGVCVECNGKYTDNDIIPLNPSDEELEGLKERMKERRAKNVTKNKRKKQEVTCTSTNDETSEPLAKISRLEIPSTSSAQPSKPITSKASSAGQSKTTVEGSKTKKGHKSIQDDPNASEVYKSIFNTHHTAKNQQTAHWVTCNPFYY